MTSGLKMHDEIKTLAMLNATYQVVKPLSKCGENETQSLDIDIALEAACRDLQFLVDSDARPHLNIFSVENFEVR